jgi:hypothetical protein
MRPDGHILSRVDLVCEDDEAAKERAEQLADGHDVELWQLGRKIAVHPQPVRLSLRPFPFMSANVQVFGRRDDEAIHADLRPASEKRQGTKSREVESGGAAGAMGILPRARA